MFKYTRTFLNIFLGCILLFGVLPTTGYAQIPAISSHDTVAGDYIYREPPSGFIEKFRNDPDFDYNTRSRTIGVWDSLMRWLSRKIFRNRMSETNTKLIVYSIAFILLIFIGWAAYRFIREKRRVVFRQREHHLSGDDLDDITLRDKNSYLQLLREAEEKENYPLAIRIHYSSLLQWMNDKGLIRWEPYKPNRSYLYELKQEEQFNAFAGLTRIFEYVCYGEFSVNTSEYRHIMSRFEDFRKEDKA